MSTLARHPDPADPDPWIGLLMVDAAQQGRGFGRRAAELTEERFRGAGRQAVRLAVLDGNSAGLAFWRTLGYETVDHRRDRELGRPCAVLRKVLLRTPRRAARTAVVAPDGAVFLFRQENVETGPHWALPGGGIEPGESPARAPYGSWRRRPAGPTWNPARCCAPGNTTSPAPASRSASTSTSTSPAPAPRAHRTRAHHPRRRGHPRLALVDPGRAGGHRRAGVAPGLGRLLAERAGRAGSGPRRGTI